MREQERTIVKWYGDVLGYMGKTYSVYIKDDELADEIDRIVENGRFHNLAHFFSEAAQDKIEDEGFDEVLT